MIDKIESSIQHPTVYGRVLDAGLLNYYPWMTVFKGFELFSRFVGYDLTIL